MLIYQCLQAFSFSKCPVEKIYYTYITQIIASNYLIKAEGDPISTYPVLN